MSQPDEQWDGRTAEEVVAWDVAKRGGRHEPDALDFCRARNDLAALADAGLVVCAADEAVKRADVLAILEATIADHADSTWRSYPDDFKRDFTRRLVEVP